MDGHDGHLSIRVINNEQLESVAALGSITSARRPMMIEACPRLASLHGLAQLNARIELVDEEFLWRDMCAAHGDMPGNLQFSSEEVRAKFSSQSWDAARCRTCGDAARQGCGTFQGGHPIECNHTTGKCLCPIGTAGYGCRTKLPRVTVHAPEPLLCEKPLPGSTSAACTLHISLRLENAHLEGMAGANLAVSMSHDAGRLVETDPIASNWTNVTHGFVVVRLEILEVTEDEHNTEMLVHLGYPQMDVASPFFLDGTATVTNESERTIFPWCVASGACWQFGPTVPVALQNAMRCPKNEFRESQGVPVCHPCQPFATTAEAGAVGPETCRCNTTGGGLDSIFTDGRVVCFCTKGHFMDRFVGRCVACGEGEHCEWSLEEMGNGSTLEPPQVLRGYYAASAQARALFRCLGGTERCPGGEPGHCQKGRDNQSVADCLLGHRPDRDGTCTSCGLGDSLRVVGIGVVSFLVSIAVYLMSSTQLRGTHTNAMLLAGVACGQAITFLQANQPASPCPSQAGGFVAWESLTNVSFLMHFDDRSRC